jgi:hypothetical protein
LYQPVSRVSSLWVLVLLVYKNVTP